MATTITELLELQKSQIEAFNAVGQAVFAATEKLVNLNLTAAKAALADAAASSHGLLGASDAQEFLALATGATQPAIEKWVGYSRNAYSIASGTHAELTKIVEAQFSDGNHRLAEIINFTTKNAPTGAEPTVAILKSAVAAANTAFDTASKAARHASEWAESNFAAAASATVHAASAVGDAAKAKANNPA